MKPGAGPRYSLLREAENLRDLNRIASPHIVKIMLDPPKKQNHWDADELEVDEEGILQRIFLEYCELGSLCDLIIRRIRLFVAISPTNSILLMHFYSSGVPFNEPILWRFFDCLVDGLYALEYCHEAHSDVARGEFWPEM